tara:strand:+ start:2819 stop:3178 length:360 start_codon:yes stop_codon:yes gene_type:complete
MYVSEPINITASPGKKICLHNVTCHVGVTVKKAGDGRVEYLIRSIDNLTGCSSPISFHTTAEISLGFVRNGEFVFTDCKDTLTLCVDKPGRLFKLHATSPAIPAETNTETGVAGIIEAV